MIWQVPTSIANHTHSFQIIAQDVDQLLSSLDSSVFNYAVMTGIQIHGPLDTHWIYPQDFYVVDSTISGGRKTLCLSYSE
jgi:hypothetical protein